MLDRLRYSLASMRRRRGIGGVLAIFGAIWWLADARGTMDTLIAAASGPLKWALATGDVVFFIAGLAFVALSFWPHPLADVRRGSNALRDRWKMRDWTDAGLDWNIRPESHAALPDGRMMAVLSIRPVPCSELPQPLDIAVACAGRIAEVNSRFHSDQSQPDDTGSSGNVEIDAPDGKKVLRLKLRSPKLLPPARWDLTLISVGNAAIKVETVKRAPRGT